MSGAEGADPCAFDASRYARDDLGLVLRPSFRIDPSRPILVAGTCVAQSIERKLAAAGLATRGAGLGPIYSLACLAQTLRAVSARGWMARRRPAARALRSAGAVVLVLSHLEAWRDEQRGAWIDRTPGDDSVAKRPGVRCVRPSHAAALAELAQTLRALRRANRRAGILCAVSPVLMDRTASGTDVLEASVRDKAVLRSALEEAIALLASEGVDRIDYFPLLELGMNAPRERVFRDETAGRPDGRRLRSSYVRDVVVPLLLRWYAPECAAAGPIRRGS